MNIKEKLLMEQAGLEEHGPINIVIYGDSVSHGALDGTIDYENVYWNRLKKKFNQFRDYVPVNMICASIAGTSAKSSLPRLEKQVLGHSPDLVIVCFGLNDVNSPLEDYIASLREIFSRCQQAGHDVIFMTPNMLNTYVVEGTSEKYLKYAEKTAGMQNSGRMDRYMAEAIRLAQDMGVPVCDCYAKWKKLAETEDTTRLLANKINHPTPEMHQIFADCLYELIMGDEQGEKKDYNTMCSEKEC